MMKAVRKGPPSQLHASATPTADEARKRQQAAARRSPAFETAAALLTVHRVPLAAI
jgi:hypothetical protein